MKEIDEIKKSEYLNSYNKRVLFRTIIFLCLFVISIIIVLYNKSIIMVVGNIFTKEFSEATHVYKVGLFVLGIVYALSLIASILNFVFNKCFNISDEEKIYLSIKGTKEEKQLFEQKTELSKYGKLINVVNEVKDYAHMVFLAVFLVTIIFTFILFPADVSQTSMKNTLQDGDRVVVFCNKKIQKGDIVVFQYDSKVQLNNISLDKDLLIKRVIATAGDSFECIDGKIYVNGELIEEEYVEYSRNSNFDLESVAMNNSNNNDLLDYIKKNNKIPDGYILVLGDNRAVSNDSEEFGFVKVNQVKGKVKYYKNCEGWKKID